MQAAGGGGIPGEDDHVGLRDTDAEGGEQWNADDDQFVRMLQGHLLVEGVPGLAKTLTVSTLAHTLRCTFARIQFTPDLLPADIVGTRIYRASSEKFDIELGPVFANFVLADEINRAPAKVQSALLEAMQERQVTIAGETHHVPEPFLVMATQNPIEQEGTYPLPEAQVDRFMLKLRVGYPTRDEEKEIMRRMAGGDFNRLVVWAALGSRSSAIFDLDDDGVAVAVFPELTLSGYSIEDILLQDVVDALPAGWREPNAATARIDVDGVRVSTETHRDAPDDAVQSASI